MELSKQLYVRRNKKRDQHYRLSSTLENLTLDEWVALLEHLITHVWIDLEKTLLVEKSKHFIQPQQISIRIEWILIYHQH